jgi:hypothetical protein
MHNQWKPDATIKRKVVPQVTALRNKIATTIVQPYPPSGGGLVSDNSSSLCGTKSWWCEVVLVAKDVSFPADSVLVRAIVVVQDE